MVGADVQRPLEIQESTVAAFLARSWDYLTRAEPVPAPPPSARRGASASMELPVPSTNRSRIRRRARYRTMTWQLHPYN